MSDSTQAVGAPLERHVRRDFGALRFSLRCVADGAHIARVPHDQAVAWQQDLIGNGREHFNATSPANAVHALYAEWPESAPRRVIGWDHEDGWPVVNGYGDKPARA